jgi:hypothetical protein
MEKQKKRKKYLTTLRINCDPSRLLSHPPHSATTINTLLVHTYVVIFIRQSQAIRLMMPVEGVRSGPPFLFLDAQHIDGLLDLLQFLTVFLRYEMF